VTASGAIDRVGEMDGDKQADLDDGAVQVAAQVLHAIVVQHRGLVRAALRNMPPLPSLAVLKEVNAVLIQVRTTTCVCLLLHFRMLNAARQLAGHSSHHGPLG
jgi:hypothetical protein